MHYLLIQIRQIRHLDYISQFTNDVRHVKGTDNVVADALSRVGTNTLQTSHPPAIDFNDIAVAQQSDPELSQLPNSAPSIKLQAIPLPTTETTILCDMSTGVPHPYVPGKFRRAVFDCLHSMSHPSIRTTQQLLTARYIWPGINRDVHKWAQTCLQCQRCEVHRHTVTPLGTFATPDARFDNVHIDIVGPLPLSNGYHYLLTCIDHLTRWPEAIPITDITAETVVQAFISGWISQFGVPSTVTTDRGSQFESALWKQLMQLLGCKRMRTTSYYPIANDLIEHFHRHLKASLKTHPNAIHWTQSLPLVLLGIRTTIKSDLHCTTAELVYGTTLRLPGEFFVTSNFKTTPDPSMYLTRLKSIMQHTTPAPLRPHPATKSYLSDELLRCTHVFVRHDAIRKPLQSPYDGPYKILNRTDKHFTLQLQDRTDMVSLDRLKPAYIDGTIDSISPTRTIPTTLETISTPSTVSSPTSSPRHLTVTCSGRHVLWPKHLHDAFTGGGYCSD